MCGLPIYLDGEFSKTAISLPTSEMFTNLFKYALICPQDGGTLCD